MDQISRGEKREKLRIELNLTVRSDFGEDFGEDFRDFREDFGDFREDIIWNRCQQWWLLKGVKRGRAIKQ